MQTVIEYAALKDSMRAAIMASCNTRATDHTDQAAWDAALTLEGVMHDSLSDREARAFHALDAFLRSFGAMLSRPSLPSRQHNAKRFLTAAY
jgi:hypothetical protein